MTDQPRWPRGTPVAPGGRGPGGGRFRDETPDWAGQVSQRLPSPKPAVGRAALEAVPLSARDREGLAAALFGDADYYAPGGAADTLHAIEDYHSVGFHDINPHLRNTAEASMARYRHRWGQWEDMQDPGAVAKVEAKAQRLMELLGVHVERIDRVLDASRLTQDVELWRGFEGSHLFDGIGDRSLVGFTWTDGAYASTTADKEIAYRFASHGGSGGVLARLIVPEGTPALRLSDFYAPGSADGIRGEAEVLLGRGLTFRVVADRGVTEVDREADGTPRMARVLDVEVSDGASERLPEPEEDYRGEHQPPDPRGVDPVMRLDDLEADMPDVYEHPEYFLSRETEGYREAVRAMRAVRGKPDATVTIYRTVPPGVTRINPGDWVSTSRTYAATHGRHPDDPSQDWPVISMQVPVRDVYWGGNDFAEFGYWPGVEQASQWPNPDTATPADLARAFGVTRAAVINWRNRHPDFPQPVEESIGGRRYYSLREVQAWHARRYGAPDQ